MSEMDDDAEALVREVLAENPPEDRGVRDEWNHQVGWHRKENMIVNNNNNNNLRGGAGDKSAYQYATPSLAEEKSPSAGKVGLINNQDGRVDVKALAPQGDETTTTRSSPGVQMAAILAFAVMVASLLWRICHLSSTKKKRLA
jgi:hypothetical protein